MIAGKVLGKLVLLGNRFEVLAELGHGGMGAVYHVADTLDGRREMALKHIQAPGAITAELRLRFKEEFRAMLRLKHPNTIEVYHYGQLDDTTQYLTMELVAGQDLASLARSGERLPLARVYDFLTQLLQALAFIHSRGYVHRDIKAQNIRIRPDGRLKLLDFGLMTRAGAASGPILGTPGYLAPELLRGGTVTPQADLYSVGCLAYELVTGVLPFEGPVRAVLAAQVHDSPLPLRAHRQVPEALETLVARLLAKEPEARFDGAAAVIAELAALSGVAVACGDMAQKSSYLVADSLVGREAELAELERLLEAARHGRGAAVFVGAPSGGGKSRLVREALLQAQWHEMVVLAGTCAERATGPLAAIAEALSPLVPLTTEAERERYRPLLARLFPAQFALESEPSLSPDAVRAGLCDWIVTLSARRPLVIALENLHWADAPTLELVNELIPRLGELPIAIVATFRPDETPAGSPVWYSLHEGLAGSIQLPPLSQAQVVRMVEGMLRRVAMPAAFGRQLYAATAGNPYFVTEMLRYMMEEGGLALRDGVWHLPEDLAAVELPANVEETVLRRLEQLSPAARELAGTAAVMGRTLDRTALQAVGELSDEALFAALDELVERHFLVVEGDRYAFPQDRMRAALYAELPDALRRERHARMAAYLEASGEAADLAHHHGRAGHHAEAFAAYRLWGDQARHDGLMPTAVAAWREAIAHLEAFPHPQQEALLAALRLEVGLNAFAIAPDAAIAALDLAFPYYEAEAARLGDAASRLTLMQCLAALANAYGYTGEPGVALAMADLLASQDLREPAPLAGASQAACFSGLFAQGHFDALVARAAEAMPTLAGVDLAGCPALVYPARVAAVSFQNAVAFQGHRPDDGLRDYALWAAEAGGVATMLNHVLRDFAVWYAWTGREDEANAVLEEMAANARRLGAPPDPWALLLRPCLLEQRGEIDDAMALARQALRYPHLAQDVTAEALLKVLFGTLLAASGDFDGAEETLWPIEARARQAGLDFVRLRALLALGRTLWGRGDRDRGSAAFEAAARLAAEGPARNPLAYAQAMTELGACALEARDHERAQAFMGAARAVATDPSQDNRLLQARLSALEGQLHQLQGRQDRARSALGEALSAYEALKHRKLRHELQTRLAELDGAFNEAPRAHVAPPWLRKAAMRRDGL